MPTARSSTEPAGRPALAWGRLARVWVPVTDTVHLLRFRSGTVRRRAAFRLALISLGLITVAAAVVPAYVLRAGTTTTAIHVAVLLPTAMAGFLVLALASAIAAGGGRELVSRDQAVAFPISPATDHLGALLMAPLNIAWLLQGWALLGSAAFAFGPRLLPQVAIVMLLWLLVATAVAQVLGWVAETVRRLPHGVASMRLLLVVGGAGFLVVQLSGRLGPFLDQIPTLWLVQGVLGGWSWRFVGTVAALVGMLLAAVALGVLPARWASRMLPPDEKRIESEIHRARPTATTDWLALLRLDRASVWRSVPIRRGMAVLAIGPGLVAVLGNMEWSEATVLPGLVASGGALLFGVNVWCLDGRGGLWRENLPVGPRAVYWIRALVISEFVGLAALLTLALASIRAGTPSSSEAAALGCTLVVVVLQVVGASMRWSAHRPFPVDLRSARATPAPPVVMVGYSARLAVSTTLTGLVFSGLAQVGSPAVPVLVALPFLAWSGVRLIRGADRWQDPARRAVVVTTVAA